jgi:hypothetical protein
MDSRNCQTLSASPAKPGGLLWALEDHVGKISAAVEASCDRARRKRLAEIIKEVVEAFVDDKMERTDISMAFYQIAPEVDGPVLMKRTRERLQKTLEEMLRTTPDAVLQWDKFATQMLFATMAGATRSVLEAGASPAMVRKLRDHLVLLCQSYIAAVRTSRSAVARAVT